MKELSDKERELLIAAAEQGTLLEVQLEEKQIRVAGKSFPEVSGLAEGASYFRALNKLRASDYVFQERDLGYRLTESGLKKAKELATKLFKQQKWTDKDTRIIGQLAFFVAWRSFCDRFPHTARKFKDEILPHYKEQGISKEAYDWLEGYMTSICYKAENPPANLDEIS